ncbi:histidine kinase [Flammeovirgaceae bacterium SG7u.111]|nr:histidine kinase [Flammeovirgaceae bacterium SG7u.132]WPO35146.1 histidine kinase [Flammeovirgaceae bacterium SG7u.111]
MYNYKFPSKALYRIVLHILFWVFSFFTINYVFAITDEITLNDYLFTGLFHISLLIGVYINLELLIPKFFQKRSYLIYLSLFAIVVFSTTFLNLLTFNWLADIVLPNYYFVSYFDELELVITVFIYLLVTSLLKLSKSWFHLQELNHQINKIAKENAESQLNALKAQINPHFLFNSLNVLHSLALKQSEESPDAIIKLADILRYVIYESRKSTVSISSEVELIKNYLSLQRYRIDDSAKVEFVTDIKNEGKIAPMLFLPLVENSFKHGIKGDLEDTFVKISLRSSSTETYFEIENNKGKVDKIDAEDEGGIGVANIKKRLDLIYPHQHSFEIVENNSTFKVNLMINHEN